MALAVKRIAVTGGGGQIAYNLLFRLANGELYGSKQPIALHLLEVPEAMESLEGVVMELEDCAFPLLKQTIIGTDPEKIFKDIDIAFLLGSKPRGPGMERKDLLSENGKIFITQGKALEKVASLDAIILVVGNPCNTNCLIAQSYAPQHRFFAMTMLDQNRAMGLLARKSKVPLNEITHMTIWGNHSSTQVPDFLNAKIQGKSPLEYISNSKWLEEDAIRWVQNRGAEVIKMRKKSSAASAAWASLKTMISICFPTAPGEWFSVALKSNGNPYGIEDGLIFSFPCKSYGDGKIEIIQGIRWNPKLDSYIRLTEKELKEEREMIKPFLKL